MFKLIFLVIIFYIVIQNFFIDNNIDNNEPKDEDIINEIQNNMYEPEPDPEPEPYNFDSIIYDKPINNDTIITKNNIIHPKKESFANNDETIFDKPNPWTRIKIIPKDEYPQHYHIKIMIPSLNDYEKWKNIIPNLDFDPKNGELIIPSKDEASALAVANIMISELKGNLSLEKIINEKLIQISISKAKCHDFVKNKIREQILENLYGTQFNYGLNNSYDLVSATKVSNDKFIQNNMYGNRNEPIISNNNSSSRIDFTSNNFVDTFQHFSEGSTDISNLQPYSENNIDNFLTL